VNQGPERVNQPHKRVNQPLERVNRPPERVNPIFQSGIRSQTLIASTFSFKNTILKQSIIVNSTKKVGTIMISAFFHIRMYRSQSALFKSTQFHPICRPHVLFTIFQKILQ
jgi:pyridoxine/pyridoxamine 5'-phosphate oxidase